MTFRATRPTADAGAPPTGIFDPRLVWTTIGANALVFLGAFEALAVTTIMPTIARELDGRALYSVAFSATLAASVVGMVIGGGWADRTGPVKPLLVSAAVFMAGLLLSGTATLMPVFIAGRFLQGLGMGALNVVLYVIVGRVYPSALHPRIFAAFSAAWVVPSMIGPTVAGFVAQTLSWHWVFLGVSVLVVLATAAMLPALRALRGSRAEPGEAPRVRLGVGILLAAVVAVAVVGVSVGGDAVPPWGWILAAAAVVVIVLAVRPLLPVGALRLRRGLPATIMLRGAIAAAFFATEVYMPYLLQAQYGVAPALAGVILTVGAVSWSAGSVLSSRTSERIPHATAVRVGAVLLSAGIAVQLIVAAWHLSPFVAAAGWLLAGGGMGIMFTRISTMVLAYSAPAEQGANSAALSIADSVGGATAIALGGLLFNAVGGETVGAAFTAAFALTLLIAAVGIVVAIRVRENRAG